MPSKEVVPTGRRPRRSTVPSDAADLKVSSEKEVVLKVLMRGRTKRFESQGYRVEPQNEKPTQTRKALDVVGYSTVKIGGNRYAIRLQSGTEKALFYQGKKSIDDFVRVVNIAPPMQLLETERKGVEAAFLGDMAERMDVSFSHLAETVGISKATAARKLAKNEMIDGAAAIALARLLAIANEIVEDSTASDSKHFDTAKWLGQWIERPQPALGGRKPSELLDTPTGVAMVTKVLGAIRSGAYQ